MLPFAQAAGQQLGDLDQAVIAGRVAILVVVMLEMVDIGHQHRKRLARVRIGAPVVARLDIEMASVADAGQRIGAGQLFELGVGLAQGLQRLFIEQGM